MAGKIRKKTNQLVSLLTLCAFLFQQISFSLPQARAETLPAFEKTFPSLDIPAGIGKIENGKTFETKKIIFHIQDAHGNEDAQKNIQAILEYLTSRQNQKIVLLEGGNGKLHPELLNFFPKNPELNLKIADSLLKKAELTGAEKFLIDLSFRRSEATEKSPNDVIPYGIENIAAYRENRQAFQKVLRARTKTTAFLSEMDDQIQRLAGPRLNILLKNFLKKSEDHETGRIDFMNWLLFLKEQSRKHLSIDLDDPFYQREWPMLIRLFRLHANESRIQQSAIASEKEAFLAELQELRLSPALIKKIKALLEKPAAASDQIGDRHRNSSVPVPYFEELEAFVELLEALPRDFSFKPYENLRLQIQSQILQSEMKSDLLAAETEHLESLVTEKLIQNETEKKLVGLYKNYGLLKKLFRLELALKEYQVITRSNEGATKQSRTLSSSGLTGGSNENGFPIKTFGNDGSLRPSLLIQQFLMLKSDHRVKNVSFSHLDEIDKLFDLALSFYAGARKRDGLMASNALKVIQHFKQDSAILVTGGFHSEGMKEYFESKGFSYYLITPNIQEIGDNKAYLAAMVPLSSPNAFIGDPKTKSSQIALMSKLQAREKILAESDPAYGNHLTELLRTELRTISDLSGIDAELMDRQYHLQISTAEAQKNSAEISKNEGERKLAEGKRAAGINASFSSSEDKGQSPPKDHSQTRAQKDRQSLLNPFHGSLRGARLWGAGMLHLPVFIKQDERVDKDRKQNNSTTTHQKVAVIDRHVPSLSSGIVKNPIIQAVPASKTPLTIIIQLIGLLAKPVNIVAVAKYLAMSISILPDSYLRVLSFFISLNPLNLFIFTLKQTTLILNKNQYIIANKLINFTPRSEARTSQYQDLNSKAADTLKELTPLEDKISGEAPPSEEIARNSRDLHYKAETLLKRTQEQHDLLSREREDLNWALGVKGKEMAQGKLQEYKTKIKEGAWALLEDLFNPERNNLKELEKQAFLKQLDLWGLEVLKGWWKNGKNSPLEDDRVYRFFGQEKNWTDLDKRQYALWIAEEIYLRKTNYGAEISKALYGEDAGSLEVLAYKSRDLRRAKEAGREAKEKDRITTTELTRAYEIIERREKQLDKEKENRLGAKMDWDIQQINGRNKQLSESLTGSQGEENWDALLRQTKELKERSDHLQDRIARFEEIQQKITEIKNEIRKIELQKQYIKTNGKISPDGRYRLFYRKIDYRSDGLYIRDVEYPTNTLLVTRVWKTGSRSAHSIPNYAFTRDGQNVIFEEAYKSGRWELHSFPVMRDESGNITGMAPSSGRGTDGLSHMQVSPLNNEILLYGFDHLFGTPKVAIMPYENIGQFPPSGISSSPEYPEELWWSRSAEVRYLTPMNGEIWGDRIMIAIYGKKEQPLKLYFHIVRDANGKAIRLEKADESQPPFDLKSVLADMDRQIAELQDQLAAESGSRSEARSAKSKAISPEDARHAKWQEKMAAVDMAAAPEVLKHYSIGAVKKISPASFGLGEHGKALLVESDQGKYILKPLTTALYPELVDGARYEVSVVNELVRKGFPAAPLVETKKTKMVSKEDRFFVEAPNGKVYLLYRFIEGKSVSYEEMNRTQFNSFVDTLASFHQTLKGFTPAGKRSRPSITDFKAQKERLDQLKALLLRKQTNAKTPLSRGEKFFLEQVDFILDQLSILNLNLPPPVYKKLPKAKIDGDYHPGNAVFQGNRVLAVFDWDHLREESRIYDFFNELFPNITSDKQRFNVRGLLRAVARYEKTQPLTTLEKEMLPEMARLKFLDLATWIVRPEKISERHQYDLSAIPPLEQALAILDRNDHVFAWFQDNLAVLKDIDQQIREGNFKIPRSEARAGMNEGKKNVTIPGFGAFPFTFIDDLVIKLREEISKTNYKAAFTSFGNKLMGHYHDAGGSMQFFSVDANDTESVNQLLMKIFFRPPIDYSAEMEKMPEMAKRVYRAPNASPKTIGAVAQIFQRLLQEKKPLTPETIEEVSQWIQEIAKEDPEVDSYQAEGIAAGILSAFKTEKPEKALQIYQDALRIFTLSGPRLKVHLIGAWGNALARYLNALENKEYSEKYASRDQETLLAFAQAIDPELEEPFERLMIRGGVGPSIFDKLPRWTRPFSMLLALAVSPLFLVLRLWEWYQSRNKAPEERADHNESFKQAVNRFLIPAGTALFWHKDNEGFYYPLFYQAASHEQFYLLQAGEKEGWALLGNQIVPEPGSSLQSFGLHGVGHNVLVANLTRMAHEARSIALWLRPELALFRKDTSDEVKKTEIASIAASIQKAYSTLLEEEKKTPYFDAGSVKKIDQTVLHLYEKAYQQFGSIKDAGELVHLIMNANLEFIFNHELYHLFSDSLELRGKYGPEKEELLARLYELAAEKGENSDSVYRSLLRLILEASGVDENLKLHRGYQEIDRLSAEILDILMPDAEGPAIAGEKNLPKRTQILAEKLDRFKLAEMDPQEITRRIRNFIQETFGEEFLGKLKEIENFEIKHPLLLLAALEKGKPPYAAAPSLPASFGPSLGGPPRSEARTGYDALESRAKALASAFRRQKEVEQADEKLNELIREWIQMTPPAQKVSWPEEGVLGFKNAENGFTFWHDLAASVQNSSFEQKIAALSALAVLLTAAHTFYAQKAKENERNRGTRLFYYDHALQPLLVLRTLSPSAENLHDLAVNYFHLDELSRAEQLGLELLDQNNLSPPLTRAVNVLIGYIKVKKAWQSYQKARQNTGSEEDAKILYRQAVDLARDGASVFDRVLRKYQRNPQDSRQIARAWTGLSSIERTFILSTQELLKMEKSRKTTASMRLEITGGAVHALHAAVQSLLTAKARGSDASYQHSLEKSYLPFWEGPNALDKILDGFVREGVGVLEDHQIQILQKNLDQLEMLLNGKTLWNENYTPVVPAADPKAQHLLAQIQTLRDWIYFREEIKQNITQHAKDLASGDYPDRDSFEKELELFVVEDLKGSPALAKILEPASHENRLQEFFQDVYSAFADLSLEELYVLKSTVQQASKKKSGLLHADDMAEVIKSANEDLSLLLENHVPLTPETAAKIIQSPFFKTSGFILEHLRAFESVAPPTGEKHEIVPYSDEEVLTYGENNPNRFEAIVTLSKKLSPWVGPARSATYQKIQDEAQKQLDFFLAEYQKWKKHIQADRKSPDRLTSAQARRIKGDLYKYRMDNGYYPLMVELERMQKNDLAFVQTYLQTGHHQGREAGTTLQNQEDVFMADSPLPSYGLARIRHYQDFLKTFYRYTGFSWAAIALQEMKEIEQTLLRIRDSEKDPDYLSFEAYQTEMQKANGIYLEVTHYQETNGVKIEKMLATVTALKETLGKARELELASEQKAIFENSLARLSTRVEAIARRLQNIPREPGYWDRTQEAKRMAAVAEKLLNQAAFLSKGAQRIQELQKTLRAQKELMEQDGLTLEPSGGSPDKDWFQKTKTAGEELAAAQKLLSTFAEERFDEKKIDIFRSKLADLDQNISPVLETLRKLTAEIAQIKKDRIFEETGKAIKLWGNFIEDFILKVFPGENLVKKSWQEINGILSDFSKEPRKQGSLAESFFRLMDAIDKALKIDDYQKIQIFREAITKTIGSFPLPEDTAIDMAAVRLLLKKEILLSVRKTSYGMPQEPQIASNPANVAPEDIAAISTIINGSYPLIAAQKIFEPWSFFDNEHSLRAWRHELLSFALTFSFYAQMLEGRRKGFSIPDAHAVLKKNFALVFKRQRDYLESKKGLAPPYLAAFDQIRQRAEKQPIVPRDSRFLPLSGLLEQRIEAAFDSLAPEEIFRRIDFTQSLINAEDSRRQIPQKVVQELLAELPGIDSDMRRQVMIKLRQIMIKLKHNDIKNIPESDPFFEKISGIFSKYGLPLDPDLSKSFPFADNLVEDILRELDRRQAEKNVNIESPPEFKIPVNAAPETAEKFKTAAIALEKGIYPAQDIAELIRLAKAATPAFKTRFEDLTASTPEDQLQLYSEIQRQILLPLHLVAYKGEVWPVRFHTWEKGEDSYGHPWWTVAVTAPPEAFSSFYGGNIFFINPPATVRAAANKFYALWAVTGKLPSSPVLKEKIRRLFQLNNITKENYSKRIFMPQFLALARRDTGNYIYAQIRRFGELFPSEESLSPYTMAFEILKKTSPLYEDLAAAPKQVSRMREEVIPLLHFAGEFGAALSQIRKALQQKTPALAYQHFLIFLYDAFYIFEKAPQGSPEVIPFTTFFKDLAREAGIPLENPDVLPVDERLKVLNAFTEAFLEKIENGEGVKGLHAPEQALQFLERIYAKHFWTEAERLERLNSKAGPSEPSSEEISPAAAMLREAYQPPAASPKTIGAVIEILRAVSGEPEPLAPASLRIIDTRSEEIAKSTPGVDAVQAAAIAKGMLRPFIIQKSKPDFPAEIKKLETYPALKLKILLTRIWAAFFVFYLEEFQVKEYRENQEPSDRETLLQLARALDPQLADLFQEFTGLMLQAQEGKTLADLPPSSVISKILAPWKDSSSGEELQKAVLYAFNYFLYPAGMLLARFPSDSTSDRFTPILYFTHSDIDLTLIHLGPYTQWNLAGSPVHYGRSDRFTNPLIPGTALNNKKLQDFSENLALWLRPKLFTGPSSETKLKKLNEHLNHAFSGKLRQSPLPYSPDPETMTRMDSFFAALKKKAFSDSSSAKSKEELIEKIKIHRMHFQTFLELYQKIFRERKWDERFGKENVNSLSTLFALIVAGNHFPSTAYDDFHDFLFDFAVNAGHTDSLALLNALLPETTPLANQSDPKRQTEQLAKILSAIDLEKLSPGLLRERASVFMRQTFGEDLFKDLEELHIRAPLAHITELEKNAPPFVRSEARAAGYFFLDEFGELASKNQITLKDGRLLIDGRTIAERTPTGESIFQILENGAPHLSRRIKIAGKGANSIQLFAEAKALLKLQNPPSVSGVPRLLGIGFMEDGGLWIELDGIADAHSFWDHAFSSPVEVLEAMIKAGTFLKAAHEKGIIHNDINPRNLLIDPKGAVQVNDFNGASEKQAAAYAFTTRYTPVQEDGLPLTAPMAEDTDIYSFILTLAELLDGQIEKAEKPLKTWLKDLRDHYLARIFYGQKFLPIYQIIPGTPDKTVKQFPKLSLQRLREEWPSNMAEILEQLEKDRAALLSKIKVSPQPAPERSEARMANPQWKGNMPQEGPLPVLSPPKRELVLESFEKFVLFKNENEQDLQILIQQAMFETWFAMNRDIQEALRAGGEKIEGNEIVLAGELCHGACTKANQDFQRRLNSLTNMLQHHPLEIFSHSALHAFKGSYRHAFTVVRLKGSDKMVLVDPTLRQFFDRNFQKGWLEPIQSYFNREENRYVKDALLRDGFIPLDEKVARIYAAAFRGGQEMEIHLPFFTKSTFHSYLFEEMPSLVDTSIGSFDLFLPEIASQRRWIDGGRSEVRGKFQQMLTISQTVALAKFLGGIVSFATAAAVFVAAFTAIFGEQIATEAQAKGQREALVTPDKLTEARKLAGDFDSKRLTSLLAGDNSFAILDLPVPEGLSPAGLRKTLEEFKPFLQNHPHKILLLAYPGSLPDHFNENLAAAFDRGVFVMQGGPEVYAGFYSGRFSKLGANETVAKDVLRRAKELLERVSAQEISHGPVTVEVLKKYSLIAGPEQSLSGLFGVAKQFVDQPLKVSAQKELEIKLLFLLPASSLSNGELLKQQPDEFEFRNVTEGTLQMLFKQELLARIQALAEAARHILSAA